MSKFFNRFAFHSTYFAIAALVVLHAGQVYAQDTGASILPEPREIESNDELKPHFGVRLGIADPAQNYNGAAEYGVEFGLQPFIPYGAGVELARFTSHSDIDGAPDLDRVKFLVRGTFNFGGDITVIKQSYFGVNVGPVFDTINGTTYTKLAGGLVAGADFPLTNTETAANTFTLGANANYLLVDSDADVFSVNGAVKYWF